MNCSFLFLLLLLSFPGGWLLLLKHFTERLNWEVNWMWKINQTWSWTPPPMRDLMASGKHGTVWRIREPGHTPPQQDEGKKGVYDGKLGLWGGGWEVVTQEMKAFMCVFMYPHTTCACSAYRAQKPPIWRMEWKYSGKQQLKANTQLTANTHGINIII